MENIYKAHKKDFIVKELELEGANTSYDKMIAVGETVTEADIEKLCDTMYQYALNRCLTAEEKQSIKRVTKNQLLAWGLLQETYESCRALGGVVFQDSIRIVSRQD